MIKDKVLSTIVVVICIFIISTCIGFAQVDDQSPDFSTVDDPMNGNYQLFTVDDLVVRRPIVTPTGEIPSLHIQFGHDVYKTENEQVSSLYYDEVTVRECPIDTERTPGLAVGRFFNLPYDVSITIVPWDSYSRCESKKEMWIYTKDPVTGVQVHNVDKRKYPGQWFVVAADDFNGNGLDDLFVVAEHGIHVISARDTNDLSQGVKNGPINDLISQDSFLEPLTDLATGDLNGDGLIDVAWVDQNYKVQFATVCPVELIEVEGTVCEGEVEYTVLMNPLQTGSYSITASSSCGDGTLAKPLVVAGEFSTRDRNGLVLIDQASNCSPYATWYEFNSDFSLTGNNHFRQIKIAGSPRIPVWLPMAATVAKLDWFGENDQIILATSDEIDCGDIFDDEYRNRVFIITFDSNTMTNSGVSLK